MQTDVTLFMISLTNEYYFGNDPMKSNISTSKTALQQYSQIRTRGPWATSLTWKTFPSNEQSKAINKWSLVNFCYHPPQLLRNTSLHLYNFKFPSPNDVLSQVWVKLAKWFWRRRLFLKAVNVFHYVAIICTSSWKDVVSHLYKLAFPSPKAASCKNWLNWLSDSWEKTKML